MYNDHDDEYIYVQEEYGYARIARKPAPRDENPDEEYLHYQLGQLCDLHGEAFVSGVLLQVLRDRGLFKREPLPEPAPAPAYVPQPARAAKPLPPFPGSNRSPFDDEDEDPFGDE